MHKYILIDASGYIFRAFYALPPISRSDKLPVGAVYGFCSMLLKLMHSIDGDATPIAVFDAARKNWRNDVYPEYKANRIETPPELAPQFAYIRKAAEAFGLPQVEHVGYEADDIIATYAKRAAAQGTDVLIYSSDKDLMQLLGPHIDIFDPLKGRAIDLKAVMDKFGVAPAQVPDVQALIGDSSDNIPGVNGIGPKTAAELIGKYGSLEELLAKAYNIKQDKRRETITNGAESARISKRLATLDADVPDLPPLSSFRPTVIDKAKLGAFFDEMEFKSLISRLGETTPAKPTRAAAAAASANTESKYQLVQDMDELKAWIEKCRKAGRFAIDTETTGLNALDASIVGISLSEKPGEACYIPLGHNIELGATAQLPVKDTLALLRGLLEDEGVLKIGHNIKYDMHIFARHGLGFKNIADTMVMSYVLDGVKNQHNMDDLASIHLGHDTIKFREVVGRDKQFANVPLDKALAYAAEDADITLRLYEKFRERLEAEDKAGVFKNIDMPLVPVLFDMEEAGILVDSEALKTLSAQFADELGRLEGEIYNLAGGKFNILSPQQLAEILFDALGLPDMHRRSTDVEALREMEHPIAAKVLEYRAIAKLKGTYSDALPKNILPRDGRVHTNYFQAGTSTGRLSSNDPNLQNIPIRSNLGQAIRRAFVAAPGHKLISADYSQVELRILAHHAGVKGLQAAFKKGEDIHAATAKEIFGSVDDNLRRQAKAINFGIIYGISAFGLARNIGIERSDAQRFIDQYFRAFPEIRVYMDKTKAFAHEHEYVETLFGRKCWLRDIGNTKMRGYAERAAINAPIQGTSADIIKLAMTRIEAKLPKGARMLLQVHDELVFEVKDNLVEEVGAMIKREMEGVVNWETPLLSDIGVADNWKDAH